MRNKIPKTPSKKGKPRVTPPTPSLRSERPRRASPSLILYCEGKNTEPGYIKEFARDHGILINNEEMHTGMGSPLTLLKLAREAKRDWLLQEKETREETEFWIVTDVDHYAGEIPELLREAKRLKICVALSNPCVELWALYHYDNPPQGFIDRTKSQKILETLMSGYDRKSGKRFIYRLMKPHYNKAILEAKSAIKRCQDVTVEWDNPTTTLFHLLERIRKMSAELRPNRAGNSGPFHVKLEDLPCCKEYKKKNNGQ